jgi:hypothetical protein
MDEGPRWTASLLTAAAALLLGWFAFARGQRVPLLGWVDLGVHELGHMLFMFAPRLVMVLMGNGFQTLLPLAVAVAFAVGRRDWPATGLCLAWAGTTLQDASVYIADARIQGLPLLVAGSSHDWAYILGPEQFNALDRADEIATYAHDTGFALLVLGVAVCLGPALARQFARELEPVT